MSTVYVFALHLLEFVKERLVRPRHADRIGIEEHHALQIHFSDPDLVSHFDERHQFGQRLAQAGQPDGNARRGMTFRFLQVAKTANIAENALEVIASTDLDVAFPIRGIERHSQFVEPRLDQRTAVLLAQDGAVRIKQNIGAAVLERAHHARQFLDEHRLADAMQDHAGEIWNLVDDAQEQVVGQIGRRLEFDIGPWTCRAEKIAAVRRLEIQAHGRSRSNRRALVAGSLEIAAWIEPGVHDSTSAVCPRRSRITSKPAAKRISARDAAHR